MGQIITIDSDFQYVAALRTNQTREIEKSLIDSGAKEVSGKDCEFAVYMTATPRLRDMDTGSVNNSIKIDKGVGVIEGRATIIVRDDQEGPTVISNDGDHSGMPVFIEGLCEMDVLGHKERGQYIQKIIAEVGESTFHTILKIHPDALTQKIMVGMLLFVPPLNATDTDIYNIIASRAGAA